MYICVNFFKKKWQAEIHVQEKWAPARRNKRRRTSMEYPVGGVMYVTLCTISVLTEWIFELFLMFTEPYTTLFHCCPLAFGHLWYITDNFPGHNLVTGIL